MIQTLSIAISALLIVSAAAGEIPQNTTAPCPIEYEGKFVPSSLACEDYLICYLGFWFEVSCPDGFWFQPKDGSCDYPSNVECFIQQSTTEGTATPPPSTTSSAWVSSTTGVETTTTARPSSTTTPQTSTTDLPSSIVSSSTANPTSTTNPWTSTPSEPEDLDKYCPPGVVAVLPHPNVCQKFILCFDGVAVERSCGDQLHFSARQRTCTLISEANCVLDGTVCPAIDDVDNIVTVANDYDCKGFFICFKGASILAFCGNYTHWDQQQQTCVLAERKQCTALTPPYPGLENDSMTCDKPGYYVLPHPRDAGKYFFCVDGNPVLTDFNQPRGNHSNQY